MIEGGHAHAWEDVVSFGGDVIGRRCPCGVVRGLSRCARCGEQYERVNRRRRRYCGEVCRGQARNERRRRASEFRKEVRATIAAAVEAVRKSS